MICTHCQTPNPDTAKFCQHCGSSLEITTAIKGERRLVTVLFADVVGSTSMAERLDPEIVTEIMNGAFAFLNDAVDRYNGTVARLMGDAIMAFFGAPVAHENDAERAVRAGLEISADAREYGTSIRRAYGFDFDIRAGINTGLVVLATVGDQVRSEYTVMGDTVNVASRLQQAADPGSVLISGETYRLVRHLFDVAQRGPVQLKGKSSPVETYEVLAAKTAPGLGRGLDGISSQLVGREDEVEILTSALAEASQGSGGLISVVGEAGLGKSRLVAEVRKQAGSSFDPLIRWIEGRALSYGQGTYHVWREALRQTIDADQGDQPATVREKLHQLFDQTGESIDHLPFLELVLGVESETSIQIIKNLDGGVLPRRISTAVRNYLRTMLQHSPIALVFDDLHWADAASMELLLSVTDLVADQPLLIVPVLRPEKDTPSWQFLQAARERLGERFHNITLEPLDAEHSGELLANLMYVKDLPDNIRDVILRKSEGNPFFLEEIVRELIDSGYIVRDNGHWRATKDIVDVSVPDTLFGVLSSRIDRLPVETKRVAQHASIIGRIFNYPVLKAVLAAGPPDERVEEPLPHLAKLTYEEFVRERAQDPDLEYIFKHVLTQEAAYNLLLVRTRREYHLRAGEVLESIYSDRLDDFAETLAHHFWHGEDWVRAADYAERAGRRAHWQLHALREASGHFERAYQALQRLPEPPPEQVCDVILAWTPSSLKFDSHAEVLRRLRYAENLARNTDDKHRLSQILHWIAYVHIWDGFSLRAIPALLENSELAAELGDERLRVYPAWMLASSLIDSKPLDALPLLMDVVEMAHRNRHPEIEAHTLSAIALTQARLGQFSQAKESLQRAYAVANELVDSPVTVGDVYLMASAAYFDMGDSAKGFEYSERGTRMQLEAQAMECVSAGYCALGIGNLNLSRPAEALKTFEESLKFANKIEVTEQVEVNALHRLVNQVLAGMAIARYENGETEAIEDIKRASEASRAIDDDYTAAMASLALGDVFMRQGNLERASTWINSALDYYRRNEMRPYLVRALTKKATLLEKLGQLTEAEQLRSDAQRISDELQLPVPTINVDVPDSEPVAADDGP